VYRAKRLFEDVVGVPKANQVGSSDNILKQTLRPIHGPQSGLDRTDYRRSAKK